MPLWPTFRLPDRRDGDGWAGRGRGLGGGGAGRARAGWLPPSPRLHAWPASGLRAELRPVGINCTPVCRWALAGRDEIDCQGIASVCPPSCLGTPTC